MTIVKIQKQNLTEKEYEELIPPHCILKTFSAHKEQAGLCWGITYGMIDKNTDWNYCDGCEFCNNTEQTLRTVNNNIDGGNYAHSTMG